jgi:hypothetical protein
MFSSKSKAPEPSKHEKFKRALDAAINEARLGASQDWALLHQMASDLEQAAIALRGFMATHRGIV